ncbi:epoxide hydrolase [Gordonia sp. (in: high G+C Gram-positive bacteria)]|uniref:epoxide hydrolase family protein n=1 Tax=Gordonia sp. (in: high G+C Gram-positive bacteria) TaxID=84139 RepID=UPI001992C9F2|nr:epoxide hydrolase [Gordonia sp. (in: high G+C Gram-positive bacteria)]MBD0023550.1 epoxide hydrolase [Gordonia sp. (in: high G+C Gram-positive bacteria)]
MSASGGQATEQVITGFRAEVDPGELKDLRRRLAATRWPGAEVGSPWQQGPPVAYMKELCEYWAHGYDWHRCEARLNSFDQHITRIDGLDLHFIHAPSSHGGATPVVLVHGWPGSVIEYLDVIEPLRSPEDFGGSAADAMHVVVPALPGYGFSGKPTENGWDIARIARSISELMLRLGYRRYIAVGTDWGAAVAMSLGQHEDSGRLLGVSLNLAFADPRNYDFEPNDEETAYHARQGAYLNGDNGYAVIQATRPQAIGYALDDSPAGLASWIVDKFHSWVDFDSSIDDAVDRDKLLDNISLYWFTRSATSSAGLYFEAFSSLFTDISPLDCPVAYTRAKDIFQISEREARTRFSDLRRYAGAARGGHFLALEQPAFFVDDLRQSVRALIDPPPNEG